MRCLPKLYPVGSRVRWHVVSTLDAAVVNRIAVPVVFRLEAPGPHSRRRSPRTVRPQDAERRWILGKQAPPGASAAAPADVPPPPL